jgi:hypothetical protein
VRPDVISPDPLPHLYRPPSMLAPLVGSPEAVGGLAPAPLPRIFPVPEAFLETFLPTEPGLTPGMPEPVLPPDPEQPVAGTSRPQLVRRRSSLRQNGRSSANGTPKVVSWAMDRDWADHLTKFDHIVYAAEFASSSFSPCLVQIRARAV